MRNEGLCTESIRAIQRYFALLPFDQGVHAHQSDYSPNSVVYVPKPIRAIQWYLASIETQSVDMTLSKQGTETNIKSQAHPSKNQNPLYVHGVHAQYDFWDLEKIILYKICTKGQQISKQNCQDKTSPKRQTNEFVFLS